MKKSIFAIAALAIGMTFAACGNTGKGGDADSTKNAENTTEEAKQECCEENEEKDCCADLKELEAPKAEDFATEEEYKDALSKYEAKVAEKYNEGKEAVENAIEEGQQAVENVQNKIDEAKQTVDQVKQDAENLKNAADQLQKSVRGIK